MENNCASTAAQLYDSYWTVMSESLDAFLPVRTSTSCHYPLTPWCDAECRSLRHQAPCLERVLTQKKLASDRPPWSCFVCIMHNFYHCREPEYRENVIRLSIK